MLQVAADILRRRHSEGWLVGGSVRDLELRRFSPDLDVVTPDDPRAVACEVARTLDVPWFVLSERYPTYRVLVGEAHLDVARVRGSGLLDDLSQRDFTMNAMAIPIEAATRLEAATRIDGRSPLDPRVLVDPFGGLGHLRERRLVAVSDRIFVDDPLRMLRAARFAHVLGFRLDERLLVSIPEQASLLGTTAAERITTELALTLAVGRAREAAQLWADLGLLAVVLPELSGERLSAAFGALEAIDSILRNPAEWFPAAGGLLSERLKRPVDGVLSRPVALRLAALAHRLPPAEAQQVGRRLKLSADAVSLLNTVSSCLAELRERGWPDVPSGGRPGREAVLLMWEAAPWEPEVILLGAAATLDPMYPHCPGGGGLEPPRRLLTLWAERAAGFTPSLPVDGDLLMRELDLVSGPLLGSVLRELRLAWEAGEIRSKDEALAAARGFLRGAA